MKTDFTDPSTIDVDVVIGNIHGAYRARGHLWTDERSWPNVTVKALADEVLRLRRENERLDRMAYVRIRVPRFLRRKEAS